MTKASANWSMDVITKKFQSSDASEVFPDKWATVPTFFPVFGKSRSTHLVKLDCYV